MFKNLLPFNSMCTENYKKTKNRPWKADGSSWKKNKRENLKTANNLPKTVGFDFIKTFQFQAKSINEVKYD